MLEEDKKTPIKKKKDIEKFDQPGSSKGGDQNVADKMMLELEALLGKASGKVKSTEDKESKKRSRSRSRDRDRNRKRYR